MKSKIAVLDKGRYNALLEKISKIIASARIKIVRDIDLTQVYTCWFVGKAIIENEQGGKLRAEYGKQTLINLSRDLIIRFGKGFSVDSLQNMRRFMLNFQKYPRFTGRCLVNQGQMNFLKNTRQRRVFCPGRITASY